MYFKKTEIKTNSNKIVVLQFVEAINSASADKMVELITEDHIFVDAGDGKYQGREVMKQGWMGYFSMFPDYMIDIVDLTENDSIIGIFGYASGTYKGLKNETKDNYFRIPAAWKAVVVDGKIKHWQVYCESRITD